MISTKVPLISFSGFSNSCFGFIPSSITYWGSQWNIQNTLSLELLSHNIFLLYKSKLNNKMLVLQTHIHVNPNHTKKPKKTPQQKNKCCIFLFQHYINPCSLNTKQKGLVLLRWCRWEWGQAYGRKAMKNIHIQCRRWYSLKSPVDMLPIKQEWKMLIWKVKRNKSNSKMQIKT